MLRGFALAGKQLGRFKERWENKMIMLHPATLMFTQNLVMQIVL